MKYEILLTIIITILVFALYRIAYEKDVAKQKYKVTIDSLNNVIAVKQRSYDSLLTEHSLSNAKMLKAFVKQLEHTKKLGAEISGRRK